MTNVMISVDANVLKKWDEYCKKNDSYRSQLVRRAVAEYLAGHCREETG
ncbi:MAG: ribbon-helix-helix domain-containing protein [Rhodospirillaceae bacterium]|nr:ribbon-helix-helix domain-containing protein [Rhodospirillaceae bacterium]